MHAAGPVFGWTRLVANGVLTSTRVTRGLRVLLDRPWHPPGRASGWASWCTATRLPASRGAPGRATRRSAAGSADSCDGFLAASPQHRDGRPSSRSHGRHRRRPAATGPGAVVGFPVQFDADSADRWYADVRVRPGPGAAVVPVPAQAWRSCATSRRRHRPATCRPWSSRPGAAAGPPHAHRAGAPPTSSPSPPAVHGSTTSPSRPPRTTELPARPTSSWWPWCRAATGAFSGAPVRERHQRRRHGAGAPHPGRDRGRRRLPRAADRRLPARRRRTTRHTARRTGQPHGLAGDRRPGRSRPARLTLHARRGGTRCETADGTGHGRHSGPGRDRTPRARTPVVRGQWRGSPDRYTAAVQVCRVHGEGGTTVVGELDRLPTAPYLRERRASPRVAVSASAADSCSRGRDGRPGPARRAGAHRERVGDPGQRPDRGLPGRDHAPHRGAVVARNPEPSRRIVVDGPPTCAARCATASPWFDELDTHHRRPPREPRRCVRRPVDGPLPVTRTFHRLVWGHEIDYAGTVPTAGEAYRSPCARPVIGPPGWTDAEWIRGHGETSITGKWDPGFPHEPDDRREPFRADVKSVRGGPSLPTSHVVARGERSWRSRHATTAAATAGATSTPRTAR